jgi:hypothetical protein
MRPSMTMDAEAYQALPDVERRLLQEWVEQHTAVPWMDDRWVISVSIVAEGQIVIERCDDPPEWTGSPGEYQVVTHKTEYSSQRPPPIWPT